MFHNVGTWFQCEAVLDGVRPRDGGIGMSNEHDILMAGAPAAALNRNKRQLGVIMNSCSAQTVVLYRIHSVRKDK